MRGEKLLYRYLKSREDVNENAGVLADMLLNECKIDAVVLDAGTVPFTKPILQSTELTYCMMNMNGCPILIYPSEERQKYMEVQPLLEFGGEAVAYPGFTYSEFKAAEEIMGLAGVKYRASFDEEGRTTFLLSKKQEPAMQHAIQAIQSEEQTEIGQKYYCSKNILWGHAVHQTALAFHYGGVSLLASEAGTAAVRLDEFGAAFLTPKGPKTIIRKEDSKYKQKVIRLVLDGLNGVNAPVKAFHGDLAVLLSADMELGKTDKDERAMTKKEALQVMQMQELPMSEEEWNKFIDLADNANYEGEKEKAYYAILRMVSCRMQKVDGLDRYKMDKDEKQAYRSMHEETLKLWEQSQAWRRGDER